MQSKISFPKIFPHIGNKEIGLLIVIFNVSTLFLMNWKNIRFLSNFMKYSSC